MKNTSVNREAVSPVIGVILMVSLTVVLSSTVYLISTNYIDDVGDEPEIMNIDVNIKASMIKERGEDGSLNGITYSGLSVDVMGGVISWEDYKVVVDGERLFTVPSQIISRSEVPDAGDENAPGNTGRTNAGETQYFTEEGLRSDLQPYKVWEELEVKIVNVKDDRLVWENELEVK